MQGVTFLLRTGNKQNHVLHILSFDALLHLGFQDRLVQLQHFRIHHGYDLGAFFQIPADIVRRISLKFVIDLMLQARPEIHRDRANLDLHLRVNHAVRQENRH